MTDSAANQTLLNEIVDRINLGVFTVDRECRIVLWNRFMENYSGHKADTLLGKNLFDAFPELPREWLERKILNVFILKNFSFTAWEHRPYLFRFPNNRPITGTAVDMRQNATFLPVRNNTGEIDHVCITLTDVTDTSNYETMLKEAVKSLAESSNRDGLTGIYNRRFLEQMLTKEVSRASRYGGCLSYVLVDLDHFKNINDTHGHLAGDEALKEAASRLQEIARNADTLGRYGGEEFAFILPETNLDGACVFAERIRSCLEAHPVMFGDTAIRVTASIGVAALDSDMHTPEELIAAADAALYTAKNSGRNQIKVYTRDESARPAVTESAPETAIKTVNDVNYVTVGHK